MSAEARSPATGMVPGAPCGEGSSVREPRIAILIVNWNGKTDTIECLKSLTALAYDNVEAIVVDNGSTDDSVEAIRAQFPDVLVVAAGQNLGTSGGRNVGIRYALERGAEFVLFLDNDTIVDSQLLANLVREMDRLGGNNILGAKIYYFDKPSTIWYAGASWQGSGFAHIGIGADDHGDAHSTAAETDYACGCALFVSREILKQVGLLDDRYFCYFEETDLCYRARAAGFRSFFIPSARVWHKVSSSSGGERSPLFYYFMHRNLLLWAEAHLSFRQRLPVYRSIARTVQRAVTPPGFTAGFARGSVRAPWIADFIRNYLRACKAKYTDPATVATLMGLRDYVRRRFGDCPDAVRGLRRMSADQRLRRQ